MNATKSKTRQEVEQQLSQIIHKLPLERVTQVVDFARFIETQTEAGIEETETEQEIQASEAKWDELFARPEAQAKMLDMANEALAEDEAGLTHEMEFDKEGNIVRPSNR